MADEDDGTIDGYQLISCIASSGSGSVHEVIEPGSNRRLAMKLLNPKHPDYAANKATMKFEAGVMKTLDHPNIVKYEGFTAGRENTYLLMEYFRAPNVKLQLKTDLIGVQMRMRKLMEGLCAALQHVHERGWVHRDIKPENVLMNKAGEVRLIDFSLATKVKTGLAKMLGGKQATIQGTRTYIAPETIRKQAPTFQTDLYSLGVLFFEVLTGRIPFTAPTPDELLQKHLTAEPPKPSEFNKNVTPELDTIILKLLSKKPDKRGANAAEIGGELRRINPFKEEPKREETEEEARESGNLLQKLESAKLDSRMDAQRSELIRSSPELAQQFDDQRKERERRQAVEKAKRAAGLEKQAKGKGGPAPQPTQPMPGMPMMMPGMPMPGMPMPMPGMPMMPGYPPGYGMPQYPGMPMMPGMPVAGAAPPMPPQPVAPPLPVAPAARPAAPVPPVAVRPPAPAVPQVTAAPKTPVAPKAPPAKPPTPPPAEDLDFMTELPDIQ